MREPAHSLYKDNLLLVRAAKYNVLKNVSALVYILYKSHYIILSHCIIFFLPGKNNILLPHHALATNHSHVPEDLEYLRRLLPGP